MFGEILKLIDEDEDIALRCCGGRVARPRSPGHQPGKMVSFPIPIAVVPGHLADEELDAMSSRIGTGAERGGESI